MLSLRSRPYVDLARINDASDVEIIFQELLPNLLPYIGVGFANAAVNSIFGLVALEGFTGIGANTVTVTGTRAAGFAIEFAGARAGQDLSAITLSYEPQVASASVAVTQQGEVKQTGTTTSGGVRDT